MLTIFQTPEIHPPLYYTKVLKTVLARSKKMVKNCQLRSPQKKVAQF